jgi:hypothetical protein
LGGGKERDGGRDDAGAAAMRPHTGKQAPKTTALNGDQQGGISRPFAAHPSHSETDIGSCHESGTCSTPPSSNTSGASPPDMPWSSPLLITCDKANEDGGPDVDVHFIMIYLDYVFPYLSPYYRPPMLGGGRGWLFDSLQSNKSVYHTAISLASYFFSVVLANGEQAHLECTNRMVSKLQSQLQLGLRELQKEMRRINARRPDDFDIREGLLVMQSIVQMIMFEVAMSNEENWRMHLDAALALFYKILPIPDAWTDTLHGLYTPRWPPPSMGVRRPWSTAQASLRFYTANLLYIDVMASITLEREPRLRRYQEPIIPSCFSKECREHAQTAGPLFMDEFIGLHNWLIQMLGDVASLDAWKKAQAAAGNVYQAELVNRGQILADAIRGSLGILEVEVQTLEPHGHLPLIVQDPVPDFSSTESTHPVVAFHNLVWLRASLVYLYIVVFGWQPENPEIKGLVTALTAQLTSLPSGSCLRGLVWPFCVAGCLSPAEDEKSYRDMVARIGPLQVFGTIKEACEIMERVWAHREQIDETWDIAKCLRILGHGALLI